MSCLLGKRTQSDRLYLENMSKVIFRVGLSFKVVDAKWNYICKEFKNFDPDQICKFKEDTIEKMLQDENLIRNYAKLDSIRKNALIIKKIRKTFGSLDKFITEQSELGEKEFIKSISKTFNLLGPTTTVYFLRAVGFELPETMQSKNFKK